jgi:beta-lactamase superfamily II metal-dependent hydrolase
MPRRRTAPDPIPATDGDGPLIPPEGGATVRMYRTGHGDCFLLAFAGDDRDRPAYVLIDCGYKPGSPKHINTNVKDITASIRAATGGRIDVAVITHEHQDHVNGITEKNFQGIEIGETWLAWTENPIDPLANKLRREFGDKLLGLLRARHRLAADGDEDRAKALDQFLEFELGGDDDDGYDAAAALGMLGAAGGDPANSKNKRSMQVFKDAARDGVKFIRPHEEIMALPGAPGVRVFALGPPRSEEQLEDLDPRGEEEFHRLAISSASAGNYFADAVKAEEHGTSPFASRYAVRTADALGDPVYGEFFTRHYGGAGTQEWPPLPAGDDADGAEARRDDAEGDDADAVPRRGAKEVAANPEWRRIDQEWLYSAERLALDLNDSTNNASLVLAFELGKGGKVLLFAADAQRGNWISWARRDWTDGDKKVTARDLLSRTVLYKVGHHGSHNATLNGAAASEHPSLGWMAQGEHGREFTAMITAVRSWAETQKGWDHPLKAIKDALLAKASGRVFQTDTGLDGMRAPDGVSQAEWNRFLDRVREHPLYFDCEVRP